MLLPHTRRFLIASQTPIPVGLSEKKGMDLIETLLQRREVGLVPPAPSNAKRKVERKTSAPMLSVEGATTTRSQGKKRDSDEQGDVVKEEEVVVEWEGEQQQQQNGMGPTRFKVESEGVFRLQFEFVVAKLGYWRSFAVFCSVPAGAALEAVGGVSPGIRCATF